VKDAMESVYMQKHSQLCLLRVDSNTSWICYLPRGNNLNRAYLVTSHTRG